MAEQSIAFGRRVRERRRALDLTREQLARRIGCAAATIWEIEADELRPSQQLAERLAMALEVPREERAGFMRELAQPQAVAAQQGEWDEASQHPGLSQWGAASRKRYRAGALLICLIMVVGLLVYVFQRRDETEQRTAPQTAVDRDEAERLATEALSAAEQHQSDLAALLSIRSLRHFYTPQADELLLRTNQVATKPGRAFSGHTDSISGLAISPDGKRAITASGDGSARIWDLANGAELLRLSAHTAAVLDAAWSRDGRRVATVSADRTARLWDAQTGTLLQTFTGHTSSVGSVSFSPDGRFLVTVSGDKTTRLWDTFSGRERRQLKSDGVAQVGTAFAPDGQTLATGGEDGIVRIWDAATGIELRQLAAHTGTVQRLVFTADGRYLVSGGGDGIARVWNVRLWKQASEFSGHQGQAVEWLAISSDGTRVATSGRDNSVRLWEIATGREIIQFVHPSAPICGSHSPSTTVAGVAFAPDGTQLLTGGCDGVARLWSTVSEPLVLIGSLGQVNAISSSSDGRLIAIAGSELQLWNAETGMFIQQLETDDVTNSVFLETGQLAMIGWRNAVKVWAPEANGSFLPQELRMGSAYSMAATPDGRRIVLAGTDGHVYVWDVRKGTRQLITSGSYRTVAIAPDGMTIAAEGDVPGFHLFRVDNQQEIPWPTPIGGSVLSMAFSPDGAQLVICSDQGVQLWDVAAGTVNRQFDVQNETVRAAAFSLDGSYVLTGSDQGSLRIWERSTGAMLRAFANPAAMTAVVFAADGHSVFGGDATGVVRRWNSSIEDTIKHVCHNLQRDFSAEERAQYGIPDDGPTCPAP